MAMGGFYPPPFATNHLLIIFPLNLKEYMISMGSVV